MCWILSWEEIFWALGEMFADPDRLPAMSEVIHYPFLFAGYLALFFTALNYTYRDWETDRKSTRLNSSHSAKSRMPSSA